MLDNVATAAFAAVFVAVLHAFVGVRREPYLEGKINALRLLVPTIALAAVAIGVGQMLTEVPGAPTLAGFDGDRQAAWLAQVRDQLRAQRLLCAGGAFVFALAMAPVHLLLGELRAFVLSHRLDLAARDQARATPRGDT